MINHIVIGAGRSGTTTLTEYLKQHNKVSNSIIKEVHYFTLDEQYAKGSGHFNSFFEYEKPINSTADTYALTSKIAPKRLFKYNPNCRITIILRNPVERAFSNYYYAINNGHQSNKPSFLDCLENDSLGKIDKDIVKQNNLNHFYGGLYYQHISEWLQFFRPQQLFICTTEQLKTDTQQLLNNWFHFLGIDKQQIKVIEPQNKSNQTKSKLLQQFLLNRKHPLRKIMKLIPFKKSIIKSGLIDKLYKLNKTREETAPKLTQQEIEKANNYFKDDLEKLKNKFKITL